MLDGSLQVWRRLLRQTWDSSWARSSVFRVVVRREMRTRFWLGPWTDREQGGGRDRERYPLGFVSCTYSHLSSDTIFHIFFGTIFVWNTLSVSFESVMVYVVGKFPSAEGKGVAYYGAQRCRGSTERVKRFALWWWSSHVCSATDGWEKHGKILLRLTCIWLISFWWLSLQNVLQEHNEDVVEIISKMAKSASQKRPWTGIRCNILCGYIQLRFVQRVIWKTGVMCQGENLQIVRNSKRSGRRLMTSIGPRFRPKWRFSGHTRYHPAVRTLRNFRYAEELVVECVSVY